MWNFYFTESISLKELYCFFKIKILQLKLYNTSLFLLLSAFFLSRYIITLTNAFNIFVENFRLFNTIILVLVFIISILNFKYNSKREFIKLILFALVSILYQSTYDFGLSGIYLLFVCSWLNYVYTHNREIIINSVFFSGIFFFLILIFLIFKNKGFLSLYNEAIYGRNYIGSVILVFVIFGLFSLKKNRIIGSFIGALFILVIKFRTAILSIFTFSIFRYKLKINFLFILFLFSILIIKTIGFESLINKWGSSDIFSSRIDPWVYYINLQFERLPFSFFPLILFESSLPENFLYSYYSNSTGLYHAPHNLFVDLIYRLGLIIGLLVIISILIPLFLNKNNNEKYFYFALLVFSMFEPSISFSFNLISIIFFMLLFNLYDNIKFK